MARSNARSSALARAQAQLAGQRVPLKPMDAADELQEYMHALSKKTSALRLSQPPAADRSDSSAEEQHRAALSPEPTPAAHSRFLKKKAPSSDSVKSSAVLPNNAKKTPTSAALRRLAEIENRHRLRKLELDVSENDSDLRTSEEKPFSNRSSSEFSTHERKIIMESEPTRQKNGHGNKTAKSQPGTIESEEEQMLRFVGSSGERSENDERWWKLPKPPRTPSPPSRSTPRRKLHHSRSSLGLVSSRHPLSQLASRTPSPPSYGSPRFPRRTHSFTRFTSRSPSPSVRSPLTSSSPRTRLGRRSRTPVSQRSDIKSLDELFFRPEDISSASSNDFKLNLLNVDDLALPLDAEEPEVKIIGEKPKNTRHPSPAEDPGRSRGRDRKSISEEESVAEADTELDKESEVLTYRHKEHSSSSGRYLPEASDESTINSVYSEDFEESVATDAERSSDLYSTPRSAKQSVLSSDDSYPPSRKAGRWRKMAANTQRVTVRDTAVQVDAAGFTHRWPQASIDREHTAAPFTDPVSIVSQVVHPDLLEALTTYNPMALALNDLLKQQLFLVRSFVDMTQQIYLSTVKSTEKDSYFYTTLEDTLEYIRQQAALKSKPGPQEEPSSSHSVH